MSIEAVGIHAEIIGAIQERGDLLLAEPTIDRASTLLESVRRGNTEAVKMFAAPSTPTRDVEVLNGHYRAIDGIMEPYVNVDRKRDAHYYDFGMLDIGQRGYLEEVGKGLITSVDVSEEIILNRLVTLQIFPNIRLAYDASRGENFWVFLPKELRRSEKDLKRFGHAAVTRV